MAFRNGMIQGKDTGEDIIFRVICRPSSPEEFGFVMPRKRRRRFKQRLSTV